MLLNQNPDNHPNVLSSKHSAPCEEPRKVDLKLLFNTKSFNMEEAQEIISTHKPYTQNPEP